MSDFLSAIQGNVVKPFRRKHAMYLFLELAPGTPSMRQQLRNVLHDYVTSAERQNEISDLWKNKAPTPPVGMFSLAYSGYVKLGLDSLAPSNNAFGARIFRQGIQADQYIWRANHEEWTSPYSDKVIDALFLLAHDDRQTLTDATDILTGRLNGIATIAGFETGASLSDGTGNDIEHFGFRESARSLQQPTTVFTPEPTTSGSIQTYGCFTSFLKIEQNVPAFRGTCSELTNAANAAAGAAAPMTETQISELAFGRRRDGQSLVPAVRGDPDSFSFHGVPSSVCPYHAHTRVMNQRDSAALPSIVRRGMTYGPPRSDLQPGANGATPPATGSGLLFLSFQRSLLDFLTLMGKAQRNFDPILARSDDWVPAIPQAERSQQWDLRGAQIRYRMADVTKILGGSYFYTPSIPFLEAL